MLALANVPWIQYESSIPLPMHANVRPDGAAEEEEITGTNLLSLLKQSTCSDIIVIPTSSEEAPVSEYGVGAHRVILSQDSDLVVSFERSDVCHVNESRLEELYGSGPSHHSHRLRQHLLQVFESGHYSDAILLTESGDYSKPVHQCLLSHTSDFFRAAFEHNSQVQGTESPSVRLYDITGDVLEDLVKYLYTRHEDELQPLLHPDRRVQLLYIANQLMLPDLKHQLATLACKEVDHSNACSMFALAEQLNEEALRRVSLSFITRNFVEVARSEDFQQFISAEMQGTLRMLSQLGASNPVQSNVDLHDIREFLAMLRESHDQQTIRLAEAKQRQIEERMMSGDENSERMEAIDNVLQQRQNHLSFLKDFILKHEQLFFQKDQQQLASGPRGARFEMDPSETNTSEFIPGYDWRYVGPQQSVPAGLEVRMVFGDGAGHQPKRGKKARIPPVWRLKLWVAEKSTYYRHDVTQDTLVGEVLDSLTARLFTPAEAEQLQLSLLDRSRSPAVMIDPARSFDSHLFLFQSSLELQVTALE